MSKTDIFCELRKRIIMTNYIRDGKNDESLSFDDNMRRAFLLSYLRNSQFRMKVDRELMYYWDFLKNYIKEGE